MYKEKKYIETKSGVMKIVILKPKKKMKKLLPGILWIHGGGYESGGPYLVHFSIGKKLAKKFGSIVISPDYRRSNKYPYPAAFDDCCAALEYMYNYANELGIDRNRIIVGGESAGGGLTVAVCLYARDVAKIPIYMQIPLYPMLDCDDTDSSRDNNGYNWNTKKNHRGWKLYLGDLYKKDNIPKYASPSKEVDYSNLPPCFTYVLDGEPFYQETIEYVNNLRKANGVAKVDIYHGSVHGFDTILFWTNEAKTAKNTLYNDVKDYFGD